MPTLDGYLEYHCSDCGTVLAVVPYGSFITFPSPRLCHECHRERTQIAVAEYAATYEPRHSE